MHQHFFNDYYAVITQQQMKNLHELAEKQFIFFYFLNLYVCIKVFLPNIYIPPRQSQQPINKKIISGLSPARAVHRYVFMRNVHTLDSINNKSSMNAGSLFNIWVQF